VLIQQRKSPAMLWIMRPQGQLINRVKISVGVSHNVAAESKWKQKGSPQDNESDSAGQGGESASE